MREIKFRAFIKSLGWVVPVVAIHFDTKTVELELTKQIGDTAIYEFDEVELMEFTGLHDSTKWEQLTKSEKEEFYNEHSSEDGRTIKYQYIDNVKHLWKGKEIYKGDIVNYEDGYDTSTENGYDCEDFLNRGEIFFDEKCGRYDVTNKDGIRYEDLFDCGVDFGVIGNIYEHKHLLEVE